MHPLPPSLEDIQEKTLLPCGCVIGVFGDAFVMIPHDTRCTYYQYALEETAAQGKPIQFDTDVDND